MLKRVFIISLSTFLVFASSASVLANPFSDQFSNTSFVDPSYVAHNFTPPNLIADRVIQSEWDDEWDDWGDEDLDDEWDEEDWEADWNDDDEDDWDDEEWEEEPSPANAKTVPVEPSAQPTATDHKIIDGTVTVEGDGFSVSATPVAETEKKEEPASAEKLPQPIPLKKEIKEETAHETAHTEEPVAHKEAVHEEHSSHEEHEVAADPKHISPNSAEFEEAFEHSADDFRALYKIYGHLLKGLNPKNPKDMEDIKKLIEIVGIPADAKRKQVTPAKSPIDDMQDVTFDPLINFSARNIPTRDAFATLARVSGKSITVTGLISDRDTISVIEINNEPFSKAFLSLVQAAEVDFAVNGQNYTILKRRGGNKDQHTVGSLGAIEVDTSIPVDERVSDLEYDGEALGAIVKDISDKYGVDIVMTAVPTDKVTLKVKGVTAEDALSLAFAGSQFQYTRKDDAFIVYSRANKNFSLGRKSIFFPLKFLEAKEISGLLPTELKANVKVSDNQNAIIVEGTKDELMQIYEFLRTVDKPIPQVELDVKLVEVSKSFGRSHNILNDTLTVGRLGRLIELQNPLAGGITSSDSSGSASDSGDAGDTSGGGTTGSGIIEHAGFDIHLEGRDLGIFTHRPTYSENNASAQLKVSQRLLVTSGKSAKINFDREINVVLNAASTGGTAAVAGVVQSQRIQRITAGNSLSITPTVGAGGMVTVQIEVEVSANGPINASTGVPQTTTRRRLSSEVQVANHETISIGGIFDNQKNALTGNSIPFLGRIPIIGNLFSNRSKEKRETELLVLITPHLKEDFETKRGSTFIQAANGF